MVLSIRPPRVSDDSANRIRELAVDWRLKPGEKLPSERELAQRLGVSRTAVREGLRTLDAIGFVQVIPSKGVFLREDAAAPLERLIQSWLSSHRGSIQELIELREALETQAASLAATRASEGELLALQEAFNEMSASINGSGATAFVDADNRFHELIARSSGNALLRRALASITEEVLVYKLTTARLGLPHRERALRDHELVLEALLVRDPAAAREAMRRHIVRTPVDLKVIDEQP